MSRHKELLKNTAILAFGKFATQFITFLLLPVYTYFLTPIEYGTFDLIMTYTFLALPFLTLRLEYAAFRFLIDARSSEDEKTRIISTTLKAVACLCAVLVIAFLIINSFIHIPYGYFALATAIAMVSSGIMLQLARGFGSNTKFAIASIITGTVTSLGSVALVVGLQWGIAGIFIATIAGNLLACIYLVISLHLVRYARWSKASRELQKELLAFGVPMVPSGMAWWAINSLDRTLIVAFIGLSANGVYAIASKYSLVLVSIATVFGLAWKESASLYINAKDRDTYFTQTINASLKLFGTLGLLLIAITPILFEVLFDPQYSEALLYIPILVIASLFITIVELYAGVYVAKKLTTKTAVTNVLAAAISIVLNLIFIQFFGLFAAAFSMTIAFGIMAIWRHFDIKKYVTIKYDVKALILLALAYVVVMILYYSDNLLGDILGITFVTVFGLLFNRSTISIIKNNLIKRHKLALTKMRRQKKPLTPDQEANRDTTRN